MFDNTIKFKYPWRSYQARVLNDIEKHLKDNKLHVIAPPGSGKTVLGLEIVRQLNKPTLILSPTITIRNQWIDRFQDLFANNNFDKISLSLKNPSFLTSSTYQSLHSALTRQKIVTDETDDELVQQVEEEFVNGDLINIFKSNNIEVIVLDEAHHLKTEWWKSLITVIKKLNDPTIIALTATPPFDSSPQEWERYNELCGPIDAEISIPELVKEKNLCPHQDLIHISQPTEKEYESIKAFYSNVARFKNKIVQNQEFIDTIRNHPSVVNPEENVESIYENIEYYSSIVIFLHHLGIDDYEGLREQLGLRDKNIPQLSDDWLEILLTNLILKDKPLDKNDAIISLKNELKKAGLIENRKIVFTRKLSIDKHLSSSLSKLRSIREIVDVEYKNMKSNLRLVVLSDFVRKEFLNHRTKINKFGVIPIFKFLVETNDVSEFDYSDKIAVLSGSICIISENQKKVFIEVAKKYQIAEKDLKFRTLTFSPQYVEVSVVLKYRQSIVNIITEMFSSGHVNIIIGTKSLLGEGWDCQAINALILATFVGSYMLSNQMRGRAIRTELGNENKTSNIWHLLCVDNINSENNSDFTLLQRRFKCFIGLHIEDNILTNGFDRLKIYNSPIRQEEINAKNESLINLAVTRAQLQDRWTNSINRYKNPTYTREIKTRKQILKRQLVFVNTIKFIVYQGALSAIGWSFNLIQDVFRFLRYHDDVSVNTIKVLLGGAILLGLIRFFPPLVKSLKLAIKHGPIASSFGQIGLSILNTMKKLNMLEEPGKVFVNSKSEKGVIFCTLKNATPYEQSLFLTSLQELLGPIKNPRYIITRKSNFLTNTLDYHHVPSIFGNNKTNAKLFFEFWEKHMGESELFYTRNKIGRKVLVKARSNSLAASFITQTEVIDSWKE